MYMLRRCVPAVLGGVLLCCCPALAVQPRAYLGGALLPSPSVSCACPTRYRTILQVPHLPVRQCCGPGAGGGHPPRPPRPRGRLPLRPRPHAGAAGGRGGGRAPAQGREGARCMLPGRCRRSRSCSCSRCCRCSRARVLSRPIAAPRRGVEPRVGQGLDRWGTGRGGEGQLRWAVFTRVVH